MSLDTIVSVTIDRKTSTPSVKGFATPLLVGYHTRFLERTRLYGSPDEMLVDGFTATEKVYKDALALFSQTPRPATFMVGRRATGVTQTLELVPTITTAGAVTSLTWNGVKYSYTNGGAETVATIITGLVASATGIAGATLTNGITKLTITSSVVGKVSTLEVSPGLELTDVTPDAGITADLDAIYAANKDWYAFTIDSNAETEIAAAAAWADTKVVLFGALSSDAGVAKANITTDIASDLNAASRSRVFGMFRKTLGLSTMAAWIARCITVNPGKINWAFKTLVGESADALSTAEATAIENKRFSRYVREGGVDVTLFGATSKNSEFVDLVVNTDWIHARVQEAVYGLFVSNDIVPYTEQGIELVRGTVYSVLLRASSANFPILDPISIVVEVPKLDETTVADRAARLLPNVSFSGRFQGALNKVVIKGSIYL